MIEVLFIFIIGAMAGMELVLWMGRRGWLKDLQPRIT